MRTIRKKNISHFLLQLLLLFLSGGSAIYADAQVRAVASLQPARIETGDTTVLMIMVTGLASSPRDPDFLAWKGLIPAQNILSKGEWRRSGTQWARKYTIIAFDSVHLTLPPLLVHVSEGAPLTTNALELLVYPTPGADEIEKMAKIRDIKRLPPSWMDYWPWLLGFSILTLGLLWWLRRPKRQASAPLKAPPVFLPELSPTERALQRLHELEQKQFWKTGQTKVHLAEISLILREFLEKKYHFGALESTTGEISRFLKKSPFPPELSGPMITLLQQADLVKYAMGELNENQQLELLQHARTLVSLMPLNQNPHTSKQTPASTNENHYPL